MNQSPVVNIHASLDATEPISLRITAWALVFGQTASVLHQLWVLFIRGDTFNAVCAFILLLGAIGVYKRVRWGRRLALVFLWGVIVVALGAMSPFMAGDYLLAGIEPPSIVFLVSQLLVACIFSISSIYILGKNKERFRSRWF